MPGIVETSLSPTDSHFGGQIRASPASSMYCCDKSQV
jgi:hypothetical protein